MVPGNDVGVQVRFDHVPDAQAILARVFDIKLDVTLRVDDCGHTGRSQSCKTRVPGSSNRIVRNTCGASADD